MKNFIRPEQFPYTTKTGWTYDSGDYQATMREAMRIAGYDELRREQAEKRARGEYMGIGVSFFTETVGAGPRATMDIAGLGMADGAELRVHPTGKAVLRISVKTQGQGHETTFAQIVAEELGIPPEDVEVVHGDTDQTPFGLGHLRQPLDAGVGRGDRDGVAQDPRQGAADRRPRRSRSRPDDLEWEKGRFFVKGDPEKGQTIQELALASHGTLDAARGRRGPPRRGRGLRPAEPHLPLRRLHLRASTSTRARARSSCAASSPSTTAASASTRRSSRGRSTAAWPRASASR